MKKSFNTDYFTVSLPLGIADAIDRIMEKFGFWPSRSAFVREACLKKIREERRILKDLSEAEEETGGDD